jgi:plasmid segregation protein ParM
MDVGLDVGYYATKAVTRGPRALFPSLATRPVESLLSLDGDGSILVSSERIGRWLVGEQAVRKGQAARKETAGWIDSPEWLALFYGALSAVTQATQVEVSLVTGLPLADYNRDRAALRERLVGEHRFAREGQRAQVVKVVSARVVPQAWGAVLAFMLDDRGRVVLPELVKSKIAVLDIGGHTVNYLSIDGLSDVPGESRSTERGAWTVMRAVREYLEAEHPGLARLRDHQLMEAIMVGETWDADRRVDLRAVSKPILDQVGQEIVDVAAQYWGEGAATFRQLIVCGGGAYLFAETVRRAFRQSWMVVDPEYANAEGFYRFAAYLGARGQ